MKIDVIKTGFLNENCYVLSVNNDCLLIDPGDEFEKIINVIGDKNVLAVLITHYHFDHIGALDDVIKKYNCDVIDYKSNHKVKIKDFEFEIIDTKGHKEDCVTFYFEKENIMFTGDFIFKDSIGRTDLKGGSYNDMLKSMERIKKYPSNTILYPGHGDKTTLEYELNNNIYMKG